MHDELLPAMWKILFLPENFPSKYIIRNNVFGHNATHVGSARFSTVDFSPLNDNVDFDIASVLARFPRKRDVADCERLAKTNHVSKKKS